MSNNSNLNQKPWEVYQVYVLESIQRIDDSTETLNKKVDAHEEIDRQFQLKIAEELAGLKARITIWGAIAAAASMFTQPLLSLAGTVLGLK